MEVTGRGACFAREIDARYVKSCFVITGFSAVITKPVVVIAIHHICILVRRLARYLLQDLQMMSLFAAPNQVI